MFLPYHCDTCNDIHIHQIDQRAAPLYRSVCLSCGSEVALEALPLRITIYRSRVVSRVPLGLQRRPRLMSITLNPN